MAGLRDHLKRLPFLRRRVRAHRLGKGHPDWERLLARSRPEWERAAADARRGARVLIASAVGGNLPASILESALGVGLTLRGAEVHYALCDRALPACMEASMDWYQRAEGLLRAPVPADLCADCHLPAQRMLASLGLSVHRYSDLLTSDDVSETQHLADNVSPDDIGSFRKDGMALGEHALAGALRFFARGTLEDEPRGEEILRRYFHAALLTALAMQRLLKRISPDVVVLQHGIYVPQGIASEVARREGVRVVTWNPAYRKQCFLFSHGDTYHHTMLSEPPSSWEGLEWTPGLEETLLSYLDSRRYGSRDWIWFHERPVEDPAVIERRLGIDFSKPCIGMLTNVVWDAQLHYPCNVFGSMTEWLVRTVEYFGRRPDLQLILRVHPAELTGTLPSRQPVEEELKRAFPKLPKNLHVIPAGSPIGTYATMLKCNAVIIFGTKTGMELAANGIPVIVAGESWLRNKGLSLDAQSVEHYFGLLDRLPLPSRMPPEQVKRAKKFAYHFFFRRMIPLEMMRPAGPWPPYILGNESLEAYRPGGSPGLDIICDGILKGTPFVFSAERVSAAVGSS